MHNQNETKAIVIHLDADGVVLEQTFAQRVSAISGTVQEKQKIIINSRLVIKTATKLLAWLENLVKENEANIHTVYFISFSNRQNMTIEFSNRGSKKTSLFAPVFTQLVEEIKSRCPKIAIKLITRTLADLSPDLPVLLTPEQTQELQTLPVNDWNTKNSSYFFDDSKLNIFIHNIHVIHEHVQQDYAEKQFKIEHYLIDDIPEILSGLLSTAKRYSCLIPKNQSVYFYHYKQYEQIVSCVGQAVGSGHIDPFYKTHLKILPQLIDIKKIPTAELAGKERNLIKLLDGLSRPYSLQHYFDYIEQDQPANKNLLSAAQEKYNALLEVLRKAQSEKRLTLLKSQLSTEEWAGFVDARFGFAQDTLLIIFLQESWYREAEFLLYFGINYHEKNLLGLRASDFCYNYPKLKELLSQETYQRPAAQFVSELLENMIKEIEEETIGYGEFTQKIREQIKQDPYFLAKTDSIYGDTLFHVLCRKFNDPYTFSLLTYCLSVGFWEQLPNVCGKIPSDYLPENHPYQKIQAPLSKALLLSKGNINQMRSFFHIKLQYDLEIVKKTAVNNVAMQEGTQKLYDCITQYLSDPQFEMVSYKEKFFNELCQVFPVGEPENIFKLFCDYFNFSVQLGAQSIVENIIKYNNNFQNNLFQHTQIARKIYEPFMLNPDVLKDESNIVFEDENDVIYEIRWKPEIEKKQATQPFLSEADFSFISKAPLLVSSQSTNMTPIGFFSSSQEMAMARTHSSLCLFGKRKEPESITDVTEKKFFQPDSKKRKLEENIAKSESAQQVEQAAQEKPMPPPFF